MQQQSLSSVSRPRETSRGSAVSSCWLIWSFESKIMQLLDATALLKPAKNIPDLGKIQSSPEGFPLCSCRNFPRRNTVPIFVGTSLCPLGNRWLPFLKGIFPSCPSKLSSKMMGAKGAMLEVQGEVCSPGKANGMGGP